MKITTHSNGFFLIEDVHDKEDLDSISNEINFLKRHFQFENRITLQQVYTKPEFSNILFTNTKFFLSGFLDCYIKFFKTDKIEKNIIQTNLISFQNDMHLELLGKYNIITYISNNSSKVSVDDYHFEINSNSSIFLNTNHNFHISGNGFLIVDYIDIAKVKKHGYA